MSVLHVLLPPPQPEREAALRRWLARGDRLPDLPDPRDSVVRRLFRWSGDGVPAAALRHHVHGADAGLGYWACADPVHVRSEATGARLMGWPFPDLSAEDARALAVALMPLFGDAGMPLTVDTPSAWCLHLQDGVPNAAFTRPRDAMGAELLDCLPTGYSGRRWRHLFNEAQVALHAHPVNASRIAAGKLPVNALWFWGAGPLPATVETRLTTVATSDDVIRGLAKVARVAAVGQSPEALESPAASGDALLDLDADEPTDVSGRWRPWFDRWLRTRRFSAIELAFPGGERFRVRRSHRLRFWRRA